MCNYLLCFSLSLSRLHIEFHTFTCNFLCKMQNEKRICMHFLCSKFPRIRKKPLGGGERKPKIWARFSTPSPPVNRAKEKHLSWKMWRERGAPERLLQTLLLFRHNSAVRETRARLCFNHEAEYSCVIVSAR